ncbi:hypothetical protein AQB9606_03074 [Aquabacterium sp. CECT 9606]|nr:hypothetical protein AQB9606_03074 [Aquabacterium sp. CECT 9606]
MSVHARLPILDWLKDLSAHWLISGSAPTRSPIESRSRHWQPIKEQLAFKKKEPATTPNSSCLLRFVSFQNGPCRRGLVLGESNPRRIYRDLPRCKRTLLGCQGRSKAATMAVALLRFERRLLHGPMPPATSWCHHRRCHCPKVAVQCAASERSSRPIQLLVPAPCLSRLRCRQDGAGLDPNWH